MSTDNGTLCPGAGFVGGEVAGMIIDNAEKRWDDATPWPWSASFGEAFCISDHRERPVGERGRRRSWAAATRHTTARHKTVLDKTVAPLTGNKGRQ